MYCPAQLPAERARSVPDFSRWSSADYSPSADYWRPNSLKFEGIAEHLRARFCARRGRDLRRLFCPGLPSPGRIASQRLRGVSVIRRVKERGLAASLSLALGPSLGDALAEL